MEGCKAHALEAEELKRTDLALDLADGTRKKRFRGLDSGRDARLLLAKKKRSCRKLTKQFSIDFQNGLPEILGTGPQLQQQSRSAIMGMGLR